MSVGQVTRRGAYLVYLDAGSLDTRLLVKLSRAGKGDRTKNMTSRPIANDRTMIIVKHQLDSTLEITSMFVKT
jgi:hypothetical protein